jgi:hypothetical protein
LLSRFLTSTFFLGLLSALIAGVSAEYRSDHKACTLEAKTLIDRRLPLLGEKRDRAEIAKRISYPSPPSSLVAEWEKQRSFDSEFIKATSKHDFNGQFPEFFDDSQRMRGDIKSAIENSYDATSDCSVLNTFDIAMSGEPAIVSLSVSPSKLAGEEMLLRFPISLDERRANFLSKLRSLPKKE